MTNFFIYRIVQLFDKITAKVIWGNAQVIAVFRFTVNRKKILTTDSFILYYAVDYNKVDVQAFIDTNIITREYIYFYFHSILL